MKIEGEVKFKINDIYYLAHGGPGSGRYPWGSGDRPYQRLEKSKGTSSNIFSYISKKKNEKTIAREIQRKNEKEMHEARREEVLKSGRASEVSKYKGELTKQELQEVYTRLNLEKKIDEISATEILDNEKIVNTALANLKTLSTWVIEAGAAYNIFASTYNSIVDDPTKRLPTLKIGK